MRLTLTQEEYSWKFIPQILQQETQRKTSPLPTLNEYSGNWSTTSLFENILYFFHGAGSLQEVLEETTSEGFHVRWAISGTVNCPHPHHPFFLHFF